MFPFYTSWKCQKTDGFLMFSESIERELHPATRCRDDVENTSLYVRATSQVRLKWNTQWRLSGTSPSRLSGTSPWRLIGTSWRRLKRMLQRRAITTSPRRLKQVSNETANDASVVSHQDVSVVRIHDIPLLRLYDISCKSQMKHPMTLLWYVSTTSRSHVVAMVSTFASYLVMSSIW